ncbi:MAG: c-type cytochrome [Bryobacteraceae bacterium]
MAANRVAMLLLLGAAASTFLLTSCGKPGPAPVSPEDEMNFHTLFAQNCQGCHGVNGEGGAVQRLNDPIYLAIVPKKTLHDTIEYGRPGTLMPAFAQEEAGPLTPKQIDALVNGIEQNWGQPRADARSLPPYGAKGNGDPARGHAVFNKACAMCHGEHGSVGPITTPSFLSLISDQDIRTIVIIGRPKLGMPDWRNHGLGHPMTDGQITDVVAYLSSLRPSPLPGLPVEMQGAQAQPRTGSGQTGAITKGNEGSGHGPGSPTHRSGKGSGNGKGSIVGGK